MKVRAGPTVSARTFLAFFDVLFVICWIGAFVVHQLYYLLPIQSQRVCSAVRKERKKTSIRFIKDCRCREIRLCFSFTSVLLFGIFVQLILIAIYITRHQFLGCKFKAMSPRYYFPSLFFFIQPQLFISILRCVTDLNVLGTGQQAKSLDNRDTAVATKSLEGILTHSDGR